MDGAVFRRRGSLGVSSIPYVLYFKRTIMF